MTGVNESAAGRIQSFGADLKETTQSDLAPKDGMRR